MAAGLMVIVGSVTCCGSPLPWNCGWNDTTCEKPVGAGSEEQKLPVVTIAGMLYCARSLCRMLGSSSTRGLMVSEAVPLALLTIVNAAVRIGPLLGAGAEPRTPVRPSANATPAAVPATDRPATPESRCRRCAWPLAVIASSCGGPGMATPDKESRSTALSFI